MREDGAKATAIFGPNSAIVCEQTIRESQKIGGNRKSLTKNHEHCPIGFTFSQDTTNSRQKTMHSVVLGVFINGAKDRRMLQRDNKLKTKLFEVR
jgi:hypothetical protein